MKRILIASVALLFGVVGANANEAIMNDTTVSQGKTAIPMRKSAQSADINNDGSTNVADLTALINILLNQGGEYNETAADVNGDEAITNADLTALVKIILGINDDPENPGFSDEPTEPGTILDEARGWRSSDIWDE